jgi:hypothetical protein
MPKTSNSGKRTTGGVITIDKASARKRTSSTKKAPRVIKKSGNGNPKRKNTFMSNLAKQDGSGCKNLLNYLKRDQRRTKRIQGLGKSDLNLEDNSNDLSIENVERMDADESSIKTQLIQGRHELEEQINRLSNIPDIFIEDGVRNGNKDPSVINLTNLYENIKGMKESISELEEYLRMSNSNYEYNLSLGENGNQSPSPSIEDHESSRGLETSYKECTLHISTLLDRLNTINGSLFNLMKIQSEKQTGIRKMKTLQQMIDKNLTKLDESETNRQNWLVSLVKHERAFWCPTLAGGVSKPTYNLQAEAARVSKIERAFREKLEHDRGLPVDENKIPLELDLACSINAPVLKNTLEHKTPLNKTKWAAKTNIRK